MRRTKADSTGSGGDHAPTSRWALALLGLILAAVAALGVRADIAADWRRQTRYEDHVTERLAHIDGALRGFQSKTIGFTAYATVQYFGISSPRCRLETPDQCMTIEPRLLESGRFTYSYRSTPSDEAVLRYTRAAIPRIHAVAIAAPEEISPSIEALRAFLEENPPPDGISQASLLVFAAKLNLLRAEPAAINMVGLWALYDSPPRRVMSAPYRTGGYNPGTSLSYMEPRYRRTDFGRHKRYLDFLVRNTPASDLPATISQTRKAWLAELSDGTAVRGETPALSVAGVAAPLSYMLLIVPFLLFGALSVFCATHINWLAGLKTKASGTPYFPTFGYLLIGAPQGGGQSRPSLLGWLVLVSAPLGAAVTMAAWAAWPAYVPAGDYYHEEVCRIGAGEGCTVRNLSVIGLAILAVGILCLTARKEVARQAARARRAGSREQSLLGLSRLIAIGALIFMILRAPDAAAVGFNPAALTVNFWLPPILGLLILWLLPPVAWRLALLSSVAFSLVSLSGVLISTSSPERIFLGDYCHGPACHVDLKATEGL